MNFIFSLVFLTLSSHASNCVGFLESLIPSDIPLAKEGHIFLGYEFKRTGSVFSEPEILRRKLNNHGKSTTESNSSGIRIVIDMYPGALELSVKFQQKQEHFDPSAMLAWLKESLSPTEARELLAFTRIALADALARDPNIVSFNVLLRTEKIPLFPQGHSHRGAELSYAKAELGPSTELDAKNRVFIVSVGKQAQHNVTEKDYLRIDDPNYTTVFGAVWHRTPHFGNQNRLWLNVNFFWAL